jgi:hypothetical protein
MSAAVWSFYDKSTGLFTGFFASGSLDVALGCPPGREAVIGVYDPALWRFDLELGCVVAIDASAGDLGGQALTALPAGIEAMAQLRAAEAESLRAMRELVLAMAQGSVLPAHALAKLAQTDQEAAARRAELPPPQ